VQYQSKVLCKEGGEKQKQREDSVYCKEESKVRDLENLLERKREKLGERETSFFNLSY
jgi:hypothetical protein